VFSYTPRTIELGCTARVHARRVGDVQCCRRDRRGPFEKPGAKRTGVIVASGREGAILGSPLHQ